MELLGYFASIFMGLSLGMIGGGGSILTVPILVYLFGKNPMLATAYSLFIVGSTALVGGITYLKKGEVDLKTGIIFAIPSFIGVYLTRAYL
ncbi:MAG: TSUP family transporter, partial [Bdellovibrionales bacterium]